MHGIAFTCPNEQASLQCPGYNAKNVWLPKLVCPTCRNEDGDALIPIFTVEEPNEVE